MVLSIACLFGPMAWAAGPPTADPSTATHPPIPDTIRQRVASCIACHGVHGEGSSDSVFPRLAGKPVEYLVRQLQNFQDGLRKYSPMEYTVRQLSPQYMHEIAEYFATQEVPYRPQPVPKVSEAILARGEQLVERGDASHGIPACVSCHGSRLTGVEPVVPGLLGLSYDYISAQIGSWRTHTRAAAAPDCMAVVANRLKDADITAVAAWLATRPPPADMQAQPASEKELKLPGWCAMAVQGEHK